MRELASLIWSVETETLPSEEERTPFCPESAADCGFYVMHKDGGDQGRALAWIKDRGHAHLVASAPCLLAALEKACEALAMCAPLTEHVQSCQTNALLGGSAAIAAAKAGEA